MASREGPVQVVKEGTASINSAAQPTMPGVNREQLAAELANQKNDSAKGAITTEGSAGNTIARQPDPSTAQSAQHNTQAIDHSAQQVKPQELAVLSAPVIKSSAENTGVSGARSTESQVQRAVEHSPQKSGEVYKSSSALSVAGSGLVAAAQGQAHKSNQVVDGKLSAEQGQGKEASSKIPIKVSPDYSKLSLTEKQSDRTRSSLEVSKNQTSNNIDAGKDRLPSNNQKQNIEKLDTHKPNAVQELKDSPRQAVSELKTQPNTTDTVRVVQSEPSLRVETPVNRESIQQIVKDSQIKQELNKVEPVKEIIQKTAEKGFENADLKLKPVVNETRQIKTEKTLIAAQQERQNSIASSRLSESSRAIESNRVNETKAAIPLRQEAPKTEIATNANQIKIDSKSQSDQIKVGSVEQKKENRLSAEVTKAQSKELASALSSKVTQAVKVEQLQQSRDRAIPLAQLSDKISKLTNQILLRKELLNKILQKFEQNNLVKANNSPQIQQASIKVGEIIASVIRNGTVGETIITLQNAIQNFMKLLESIIFGSQGKSLEAQLQEAAQNQKLKDIINKKDLELVIELEKQVELLLKEVDIAVDQYKKQELDYAELKKESYDMYGYIRSLKDGSGISGVSIYAGMLGVAVSDHNGYFTFNAVPEGTSYTLVITKPGLLVAPSTISGVMTGPVTHYFAAEHQQVAI